MLLNRFAATGLVGLALSSVVSAQGLAGTNIIYVLDASNSMWGQIDGVAKIETAREAMGTLVSEAAASADLGLVVYGHRREGDCGDIELLAPLGEKTPAELTGALASITPKGKTPIAGALQEAGKFFPTNDAANYIVLISDGIETCEGEPCAVAAELAASGVKTRIHAIGFDVDDEARAQLECVAEAGGGSYYDADNAEEFRVAVAEATKVAQAEPAQEPDPEPAPTRVFFDDFESELSEDWVVHNPNPDAFIVEDSNLLMLNSDAGGFSVEDSQNIIALEQALPDGDWDAIITFTGEFKTGRDTIWFGLWKDQNNYLGAQFWTKRSCCGCSNVVLRNQKSTGGDQTSFDVPVRGGLGCSSFSEEGYDEAISPLAVTPSKITLHKRGRSYHASMEVKYETEDGKPTIVETDKLTSLRSPGNLAISIGKWEADAPGELLVMIDSVEILSVPE